MVYGVLDHSNGPITLPDFSQPKKFEKLDKRVVKCKKRIFMNKSTTTSLWPNLGAVASLNFKADASFSG